MPPAGNRSKASLWCAFPGSWRDLPYPQTMRSFAVYHFAFMKVSVQSVIDTLADERRELFIRHIDVVRLGDSFHNSVAVQPIGRFPQCTEDRPRQIRKVSPITARSFRHTLI